MSEIDEKTITENTSDNIVVGEPDAISEPKKRGRRKATNPAEASGAETLQVAPPGSEPKARKKRAGKIDYEAMAKQLQGLHIFIATATGMAELAISEDESKLLTKAASDFGSEFGFEPSPKIMASIQLFGACAIVYGPRLIALRQRDQAAAKEPLRTIKLPQQPTPEAHSINFPEVAIHETEN